MLQISFEPDRDAFIYKALANEDVADSCKQIVTIQQHHSKPVICDFKDIELIADGTKTTEQLIEYYYKKLDQKTKLYFESDTYKLAKLKREANIANYQLQLNSLIEELPTLDFLDHEQVLDWLCRFQPLSDYIGVLYDSTLVLNTFALHGYIPKADTTQNYLPNDKADVANYIISRVLHEIEQIEVPDPIIHNFVTDWKLRFK